MRRKHAALEAALDGRMREHQRFLLGMQLRSLGAIDQDLDALDARIGTQLEPYQAQHRLRSFRIFGAARRRQPAAIIT